MKTSKDPFIHIADDWYFTGDKFCLSLYRRRISGKGKIQYDCEGYYTDYGEMLRALAKKEIFPRASIEDIIKGFDYVEKLIKKLHQEVIQRVSPDWIYLHKRK